MNTAKAINRIPSLPYWRRLLLLAGRIGPGFYLVGGTIRDLLLDRPVSDIDLVVPCRAMSTAREFARLVGGAYVPLDPQTETARVVVADNVFDFSVMKGESITEDLARRDFTVNAMAFEIGGGRGTLMDPLNGLRDLYAGRLVPCSEAIFVDDPLRVLRAYRLMVAIRLDPGEALLELIRKNPPSLAGVSAERIREELIMILACPDGERAIRQMESMGILQETFPEIGLMKATRQNRYHHLDVLGHSLLVLENLEMVMSDLPGFFGRYSRDVAAFTDRCLVRGRPVKALVKLGALFHDVGKPETFFRDKNGVIHFYGHERAGGLCMRRIGKRLKLSRREVVFLERIVTNHMRPRQILVSGPPSVRSVSRFFRYNSEEFWALFCLHYADLLSKKGPEASEPGIDMTRNRLMSILSIYYKEIKPRASRQPLLTGRDLIERMGLDPGPLFKKILAGVDEAYIEGRILNKEEALELARRLTGAVR